MSALFLHHVRLQAGDAIYLGAGNLHAYLEGTGIEIMAASDNVLRGGLTKKHVDVPELLACLDFAGGPAHVLKARELDACESVYDTPAAEFRLSRIRVSTGISREPFGPEILLTTDGSVRVGEIEAPRGTSVLVGVDGPLHAERRRRRVSSYDQLRMTDGLLDEIAAHPEVDDARLVWADREGAERGELVIVQCALAKGGQSRAERRKLYARERELLAKAWPELKGLEDPRFERGFVTHATVKLDELPRLLAVHPLLKSVELADARVDVVGGRPAPPWHDTGVRIARIFGDLPPGRIARVKAEPVLWVDNIVPRLEDHLEDFLGALGGTHAGRAIRGLELVQSFPRAALTWLTHWMDLEELRIECNGFGIVSLAHFSQTHPRLTRLELRRQRGRFTALPTMASFTELDIGRGYGDHDFIGIAHAALPNLRRLGLANNFASEIGYRWLAAPDGLAQLEALDVSGTSFDDARLAILTQAKFAPTLRVLELRDTNKLTAAAIPHLLSFRSSIASTFVPPMVTCRSSRL